MSVSIVAIPVALSWAIQAFALTAAVVKAYSEEQENKHYSAQQNLSNSNCNDYHVISESSFLEKSLETPFMDKEILIKTLEEHGVKNITEEYGTIKGQFDTYSFSFEKTEAEKPYYLTISYINENNLEEKLNDLGSEYALNVQEDAYLSIIEKLKDNNMEIEEEEVLEDNTIVLTVNLEQ